MEIQRDIDKIKEIVSEDSCAVWNNGCPNVRYAAMKMAEWKEQQFAEDKEKWIEKAIGWIDYNNRNGGCWFDGWEECFKQAMEE